MRAEFALIVTMGLAGSSMTPEVGMAQQSSAAQKPATEAACGFCLEDGTKVPLTLGRELSSGNEVTGNRVDFIVAEDILVKGVVVIPKGSKAMGTIVQAQGKRRMGRAGKLDVSIEEVRLADGQRAKLRASQEVKGKGRQGVMTGAMIATGVLFFPAAPVFLLMKGKDVVIAEGTPVTSYVEGDTPLEEVKFESAPKAGEDAEAVKIATPVETQPSAPTEPPAPKTPPRE